jgi:high-affinity iron transporter
VVGVSPLSSVPRLELLGLFPTVQTVAAQALMIVALVVGFSWNRRKATRAGPRSG